MNTTFTMKFGKKNERNILLAFCAHGLYNVDYIEQRKAYLHKIMNAYWQ